MGAGGRAEPAPKIPQPLGRWLLADETKNGAELPEDIQPWTAKRRAALVLAILRGETSVPEGARKHDLTVAEVEAWKDRFLLAAENAPVSYTHLRAHETVLDLVCRLL